MLDETYIFYRRNNPWTTAGQGMALGNYPADNLLVSGFAAGEKFLVNSPGVILERMGKGKVVLINFEPVFRAQPVSTFKLVFNSLYYSMIDDK
jgi:hypothetical protein